VNDNPNQLAILTKNRQTGQDVTILLNVPGAEARKADIQELFEEGVKNDDQVLLEETLAHGKEYVVKKYKADEFVKKQADLNKELVKKGIMKKTMDIPTLCKHFDAFVRRMLHLGAVTAIFEPHPLTDFQVANLLNVATSLLQDVITNVRVGYDKEDVNAYLIFAKTKAEGQDVKFELKVHGAKERMQKIWDLRHQINANSGTVLELSEFEKELRKICPNGSVVSRLDNEDPEESRFAEIMQKNEKVWLFIWHENGDFSNLWDDFNEEFLGPLKTLMEKYKKIIHCERLDSTAVVVSFEPSAFAPSATSNPTDWAGYQLLKTYHAALKMMVEKKVSSSEIPGERTNEEIVGLMLFTVRNLGGLFKIISPIHNENNPNVLALILIHVPSERELWVEFQVTGAKDRLPEIWRLMEQIDVPVGKTTSSLLNRS
jgi:hypothetical protein